MPSQGCFRCTFWSDEVLAPRQAAPGLAKMVLFCHDRSDFQSQPLMTEENSCLTLVAASSPCSLPPPSLSAVPLRSPSPRPARLRLSVVPAAQAEYSPSPRRRCSAGSGLPSVRERAGDGPYVCPLPHCCHSPGMTRADPLGAVPVVTPGECSQRFRDWLVINQ